MCFSTGFPSAYPNMSLPFTSQGPFQFLILEDIFADLSTSKLPLSTYFVRSGVQVKHIGVCPEYLQS